MKYKAYPTFIDYLFSEDSKSDAYSDLVAILTVSSSYEDFYPTDGYTISTSTVEKKLLDMSDFTYPSARVDHLQRVSNSNGLLSETDKSYQEVFNIPASENLESCPYISNITQKERWNAELNGTTLDGSAVPMKSSYDEVEYDSYGIPLDFLNGDVPGVVAEAITYYGDKITLADGCLFTVKKGENLIPIGYVDFESVIPATSYEVKLDPQGFLQLK